MPNPRFNKLKKPIVLPDDNFEYIYTTVHESITAWIDWKNYDIKPWDVKGKILSQDINNFNMIDKIYSDVQKYKEAKAKQDAQTDEIIRNELNAGRR